MEGYLNNKTFVFSDAKVTILHKKVLLNLRTSFGTSHSSTTIRSNSFIQVIVEDKLGLYGIGEIGLPPKKPYCYLADNEDIKDWLNGYFDHLSGLLDYKEKVQTDFSLDEIPQYIHTMIHAIDTCPLNSKEYSKAARNGLEGALLDLAAKIRKLPLNEFIGLKATKPHSAFYTVGITGDEELMQSLEFGLQYTHYIKIKLNKDIKYAEHVLDVIDRECKKIDGYRAKWSVDLNSDFNEPDLCLKLINEVLVKYADKIYMVEQPFPVKVDNWSIWKSVKEACESKGMLLFADESVSTVESIEPIKNIVSGINIKLEKCGGHRAALKCIQKANELGLKVWIGAMVGSSLLTNMGIALTPASVYSDLDGELLVTKESQPCTKGFTWDVKKGIIRLSEDIGVGVSLINEKL